MRISILFTYLISILLMQSASVAAQSPLWVDSGGTVGVGTEAPEATFHVKVDDNAFTLPFIVENTNAINFSGFRLKIGPDDFIDFNNSGGNFRINADQIPGAEFEVKPNGNATLSGMLTENSDVHSKQGIVPVDQQRVLAKVMQLPVSEWSYTDAPGSRHMGPMAQDFYKSFGLGHTEKGISSIDTAGVALAAIQGMKREKDADIAHLQEANVFLKSELQRQAEKILQLEMALAEILRANSSDIQIGSVN